MSGFLDDAINTAIQKDASDIYIQSESPVFIRIRGRMTAMDHRKPEGYEIDEAIEQIMRVSGAKAQLYDKEEKDLSYTRRLGTGEKRTDVRFRVNICLTKKGASIVMRRLKAVEKNPLDLGVPAELLRLILDSSVGGIIFIAGPTGSGKSTTLASIIAHILDRQCLNCVTIEDPIEYDIPDGMGNIIEREVGTTTLSFDRALRASMRQRPDVILVGEVRDPETALAAIQAAKTGHLVFTTIHTIMTTQVPSRIASMFSAEKQAWIIQELSDVLLAVMVQMLVSTTSLSTERQEELVLATEFLDTKEGEVRNLLRKGDYEILREQQRKGAIGWTLNQSLRALVGSSKIGEQDARRFTNDLAQFMKE